MKITQLKRRQLDAFIFVLYQVKTKVTVTYNDRLCTKDAYSIFGVDSYGHRKLLNFGINFKENSEFWLNIFNDIKNRGVQKILFMISMDNKHSTRAAQINFPGIKILDSPYLLIDKIQPYFTDSFTNTMPINIRDLYLCDNLISYKDKLDSFNVLYSDYSIVSLLLEKNLLDIENLYNLDYNTRKLLFSLHFIREFKQQFKSKMNKLEVVHNINDILSDIYISKNKEKAICIPKQDLANLISFYYEDLKEFL